MNQRATIIPINDPAGTYTTRGGSAMREQPSREILSEYQRGGVSWQAVDTEGVREMVDTLIALGQPFSERMALVDLHYWIDRQQVRPHRYYAQRWKWGLKRAYNLFVELGIYGAKSGSREGASGEQVGSREGAECGDSTSESNPQGASGEQVGSREGASGEQYNTSSSPSSSEESLGQPKKTAATSAQAEVLYQAYPKHVAKQDALRKIRIALKTVPFDTLLERVTRYAAYRKNEDPKYTPNPGTWFNQGRYDDDDLVRPVVPSSGSAAPSVPGNARPVPQPNLDEDQLRYYAESLARQGGNV